MLADYLPIPAIAVKDLERARAFYEGTLGFSPAGDVPDGVMYRAGNSGFLVYPSEYAGTNKATAMSFQVTPGAFDDEVAALRAKGLSFQTFDIDGLVWDGDVAIMGDAKAVWFADPDGNVLNLESAQVIS
ncbi:VOC family protein [Pengzhenrongella frigida]|uniref:VOC family protein n=1 Tax=Pengzhenrongella frigida TaxID=1259133 RepID=A0A4Q5N1V9_9MICO|nr:VOC family protein [Cellulomonas sp. HLT2-17]RYV52046.1 VOC family protein [Cellulomonas sp. HLT2-17]